MSVARPKKPVDDYEEVITELKTRVQVLEGETDTAVTERENFTADYEHLKTTNRVRGDARLLKCSVCVFACVYISSFGLKQAEACLQRLRDVTDVHRKHVSYHCAH